MRNLPGRELQRSCHCSTCMSEDIRKYTQRIHCEIHKQLLHCQMFSSNMPSSYGDNSTLLDDDQPLISPILFSLLLCLTYGNYCWECAQVRPLDYSIFHKRNGRDARVNSFVLLVCSSLHVSQDFRPV